MTPETLATNQLNGIDSLFLYLEKQDMPLHIGAVCIFDGPLSVKRLMKHVEARLPLIPRYRQRLVFPPLNISYPSWEFDPNFDIRNHFRHIRLKTGTKEELEDLAAERFGVTMDRNRPMWEITVVDGLEGGRGAIIPTVHHCLVDGVAGVGLINILLDATPKPPRIRLVKPDPPPVPKKPVDATTALVSSLLTAYSQLMEKVVTAQVSALNLLQCVLADPSINSVETLVKLLPTVPLLTPINRLPFNAPVHGQRLYRWTEFPVPELNVLRKPLGGKLNDVALAMITRAVQRYTVLHGQTVEDRILRIMAPVNLRKDPQNPGFGNDISLLPVNVPLGITDPVELLHAVHKITTDLKRAHVAQVVHVIFSWLGITPTPLQAAFGQLGNIYPVPPFHMVCTNIPGPDAPLYALGRKMLTYYPYVPIGNEMGVCCAFMTYNGTFYFGFSGDAGCAPDLNVLRDYLNDAFLELKAAAKVAVPAPKKRARPKAAAQAEVAAPPESAPVPRASRKRAAEKAGGNGAGPIEAVLAAETVMQAVTPSAAAS